MSDNKSAFLAFLKSQADWNEIWDESDLDNWAAGKEPGILDHLYAAYTANNTVYIQNYVIAESGHNLERQDWVNYKADAYTPEINYLTGSIVDEKNRLAQYQSAGGNDTAFISSIQDQINLLQKTLDEYHSKLAAEQ